MSRARARSISHGRSWCARTTICGASAGCRMPALTACCRTRCPARRRHAAEGKRPAHPRPGADRLRRRPSLRPPTRLQHAVTHLHDHRLETVTGDRVANKDVDPRPVGRSESRPRARHTEHDQARDAHVSAETAQVAGDRSRFLSGPGVRDRFGDVPMSVIPAAPDCAGSPVRRKASVCLRGAALTKARALQCWVLARSRRLTRCRRRYSSCSAEEFSIGRRLRP